MWHYSWSGINLLGETHAGKITARSRYAAKQHLLQQGIVVQRLHRCDVFTIKRPVSASMLSLCFQQLANSLRQNMPIVSLMQAMALNQSNLTLRKILDSMQHQLRSGHAFSEAMTQHPDCFSTLVCHWVRMGERFGTLPDVFQYIADDFSQQAQFKQRVRKALTYPLTILLLSSLILFGLLTMVVPQFEAFYHYFSATMPWPTRGLIYSAHCLQQHGVMITLSVLSFGYLFKKTLRYRSDVASKLERWVLRTPLIGPLLRLSTLARLVNTLRTTYACGASLLDAFEAIEQVAGYQYYRDKIRRIINGLKQGEPVCIALEKEALFPTFLFHLFRLGEETGTLSTTLQHMASHCEHEVEQRLTTFTTVFEPLLMALLGLGIGALILALYLPILNLGNVL